MSVLKVKDEFGVWKSIPAVGTYIDDGSITYEKLEVGTLGYVTPEMFGAKGDGVADDTEAIQDALNFGVVKVIFSKKTYKISIGEDGYAFNLPSDIIIDFNGADIFLEGNSLATYQMFYGYDVNNIVLKNGHLVGDADSHTITSGTTDEWGHVIHLTQCENVSIENMTISKAEGDGVYLNGICENIFISNSDISNNGRNNITVVSANPCYIENVTVSNATRVAPMSGIDIEPNSSADICNVVINSVVGFGNGQALLQVSNSNKGIKSCIVSNAISDKRITINNPEADSELKVEMSNLVLNGTDQAMLHLCNQSDNSNINISNVSIVNDYANSEDILFFSNLYDTDIRNISLDNISIDASNSLYPVSNSRQNASVKDCSFRGSIKNVWSGYQNPHINGLKMVRTNKAKYTVDTDISGYNYQYNLFECTKEGNAYIYYSESDAPDGYEIELINNGTGGFVFRCNNAQKMAMGGEVKQYVRLNPDARAVIKYNNAFGVWFVHDYFGTVYIG